MYFDMIPPQTVAHKGFLSEEHLYMHSISNPFPAKELLFSFPQTSYVTEPSFIMKW